jgi:hypothetical protein
VKELIFIIDDDDEYLFNLHEKLRDSGINCSIELRHGQQNNYRQLEEFCLRKAPDLIVTSTRWGEDGQQAQMFIENFSPIFPMVIVVESIDDLEILQVLYEENPSVKVLMRDTEGLIDSVSARVEINSCEDDSLPN